MNDLLKERPVWPGQLKSVDELVPNRTYYVVFSHLLNHCTQFTFVAVAEKDGECKIIARTKSGYIHHFYCSDIGLTPYVDGWNPTNYVSIIKPQHVDEKDYT